MMFHKYCRTILTSIVALVIAACAPSANPDDLPPRQVPTFPSEWRFTAGAQEATFAEHAMVTSGSRPASQAGIEILRRGGNAIDAAVATGFALAVTAPAAGNLGGGGFMVIRMAEGGTAALDFREVAPLAATADMYLDSAGTLIGGSMVGHLAVAVPGSVAGLAEAHARYGELSLAEVMAPAIRLASEGFSVHTWLSRGLEGLKPKLTQFGGREIFYTDDGAAPAPGTLLKQPDLARTLRLIANEGPEAFYEGAIADLIVAEMKRGGGLITHEDLANYRPVWREPVRGSYRGYSIIGMPLPSSGGTTIVEALNILETFAPLPPFRSVAYKHLLIESFRRAFVDRNTELCDPAFCDPPVARLTSEAYARGLAETIDPARATPSPDPVAAASGMHTTHFSVVDARGNAVAVTTTLNMPFGSGVVVKGAGFFLNNEMGDFALDPGQADLFGLVEGSQNRIEPGKRPLSSMSPTIVLDPAGEVLLVLGAAGGPRIITGTMQVILNVIEHRMSWADAMHAPRLHHQAWPDSVSFDRGGLTPAALDSLRAMGHHPAPFLVTGVVNGIMRESAGWYGLTQPAPPALPDPPGAAVGY